MDWQDQNDGKDQREAKSVMTFLNLPKSYISMPIVHDTSIWRLLSYLTPPVDFSNGDESIHWQDTEAGDISITQKSEAKPLGV